MTVTSTVPLTTVTWDNGVQPSVTAYRTCSGTLTRTRNSSTLLSSIPCFEKTERVAKLTETARLACVRTESAYSAVTYSLKALDCLRKETAVKLMKIARLISG